MFPDFSQYNQIYLLVFFRLNVSRKLKSGVQNWTSNFCADVQLNQIKSPSLRATKAVACTVTQNRKKILLLQHNIYYAYFNFFLEFNGILSNSQKEYWSYISLGFLNKFSYLRSVCGSQDYLSVCSTVVSGFMFMLTTKH